MARISDDELNRLKAIDLVALVTRQGYQLKPHGKDRVMACPFHEDDTPSLVISPDKNLWHCLGACQTGGSVIDWVMQTEGVSFRHACELLRGDLSTFSRSVVERSKGSVKRATIPKLDGVLTADGEDQALLLQVIEYYHAELKKSERALDYLKQRGLDDPELIDRFKLGFADRTLGYHLPEKNRAAGAAIRGRLRDLGVLKKTGHEHFRGSLVVPVFSDASVVEIYGRKVHDRLRKGTPKHLYLPGPHAGVWNADGLTDNAEVILCESLIDAMTFWVHGFRHVTASYGTSGFTAEHLALFQQNGVERVLIAYDRDAAGNQAALKLADQLSEVGIETYRVLFPKGMDANEYAVKMRPPAKALEVVLRKAELMKPGDADKRVQSAAAVESEPLPELAEETMTETGLSSELQSGTRLAAEPAAEPAEDPEPIIDQALPGVATPAPQAAAELAAEVSEREVKVTLGDRRYRVRGLNKNQSYDSLKVTVMVSRDDQVHVDTLDLYQSKARAVLVKQTAVELGIEARVIQRDIGKLLLKLEALQEQQIAAALAPSVVEVTLSAEERTAALELLTAPDLLDRIVDDLSTCGLVGESSNKLVSYLACVSRKLDKPLAVMIQSTSAAGKSTLMDTVLELVPEEDRVAYSAMTGQSLYYMNDGDLRHKVLAIAEEQGVQQASYALKLLQSQGELTIASTGKDPDTGKLVTEHYQVQGPVMLFLTTTAIEIDEELLNRCLVLTVDESRQQTQRIHEQQRKRRTLEGLKASHQRQAIQALHANAQRLLRPLAVLNPYAEQLTFVSDSTRTRRDHEKYLTLIDSIALLHQHQREVKQCSVNGDRWSESGGAAATEHSPLTTDHSDDTVIDYIEVSLQDIELANALAHQVLGQSLDELPPQTRRLLGKLQAWVIEQCQAQMIKQSDYRFSRRQLREALDKNDTQLRVHLARLVELEYLLVHRGGRGQSFVYELLYDGDVSLPDPRLMGLIQPDLLNPSASTNKSSRGKTDDLAGSARGVSGPVAVGSRGSKTTGKPHGNALNGQSTAAPPENARTGISETTASYA